MPKMSPSPAAYSDVRTVMDLALQKPGLIYRLPTAGQAINFRQRCHRYAAILRDQQTEQAANVPGFRAETVYDTLLIRQLDESGKSSNRGRSLQFTIRIAEGELIDPETGQVMSILPLGEASPSIGESE